MVIIAVMATTEPAMTGRCRAQPKLHVVQRHDAGKFLTDALDLKDMGQAFPLVAFDCCQRGRCDHAPQQLEND